MLEARIVSSTGSLYFAGKPTVPDLESLRAHVRDFAGGGASVHLDVSVTDAVWAVLSASGWLDHLAHAGAVVRRGPLLSATAPAPRAACA